MEVKKRGGAREGAGRPVGEMGPKKPKKCTVTDSTEAILSAFGDGNFSEGLDRAAKLLLKQKLVEVSTN
ncbi:hypothetical protein ACO0LM_11885 [Undibacterium sp. Di26W]|uniref:hypothetical protein n=1 Tax=Undibacterium sp. Di26W TaxID=3413035 RepID=UPI003BF35EA5